jgi:hypothetical protein
VTVAASARTRSAVATRAARAAQAETVWSSRLRTIVSAALLLGAGLHLDLGVVHAGTNFGALSLLAAAAQLSLGIGIYLRRSDLLANLIFLLELVLLQLYLLNVTVGLPPAIAHVHAGGEHVVWGYSFALPGVVDFEGVTAVVTEVMGALSAAVLIRGARSRRGTSG